MSVITKKDIFLLISTILIFITLTFLFDWYKNKKIHPYMKYYFQAEDYEVDEALSKLNCPTKCQLINLEGCKLLYNTFLFLKENDSARKEAILQLHKTRFPVLWMRRTIAVRLAIDEKIDCHKYEVVLREYLKQRKVISEKEMLRRYIKETNHSLYFKKDKESGALLIFI